MQEKLEKQLFQKVMNRRFLISNKLEQLEFKLEKDIWIQKHKGKVRKW